MKLRGSEFIRAGSRGKKGVYVQIAYALFVPGTLPNVKKGKKKLNYQLSLELAYIPLDHSVVNIYIFIFIRIYLY